MPKSKPPRTNISKSLDTIFTCDREDERYPLCIHAKKALKQTLLTYIKELVGEEEETVNPITPIRFTRNQLRQEILKQAKEDLND